jgi:hypothetical protein
VKLEDQVCSYEQAVKLTKYKLKFDSLFYYLSRKDKSYYNGIVRETHPGLHRFTKDFELIQSYTASELMEMLPFNVKGYQLNLMKCSGEFKISYEKIDCRDKFEYLHYLHNGNFAYALAEMLIFLLVNKHIKL